MSTLEKVENVAFKRLFAKQTIILQENDGHRTIASSKDVFDSWLSPRFKGLGLDKPQKATAATEVSVYELAEDDFSPFFINLCRNPNRPQEACLTQSQIVDFCQKHKKKLDPYRVTSFIFEENGSYYVALLRVRSGRLLIFVDLFNLGHTGRANRMIVPKI
jgi:hypothetical protein